MTLPTHNQALPEMRQPELWPSWPRTGAQKAASAPRPRRAILCTWMADSPGEKRFSRPVMADL